MVELRGVDVNEKYRVVEVFLNIHKVQKTRDKIRDPNVTSEKVKGFIESFANGNNGKGGRLDTSLLQF